MGASAAPCAGPSRLRVSLLCRLACVAALLALAATHSAGPVCAGCAPPAGCCARAWEPRCALGGGRARSLCA
jgi:hypothetical protein